MTRLFVILLFVTSIASAQTTGTSVAMSPRNNKNIVVYSGGKIKYSNDQGATWQESSVAIPTDIIETPLVSCDVKGNFYLFYTSANQLTCVRSGDNGKSWNDPALVAPTPGKVQYNPGVGPHNRKDAVFVTWTEMNELGSNSEDCKSSILLTAGNGKKWDAPIVVNQNPGNCLDEDFTVRGSAPVMAFDNKMFIEWAAQGAMFYDRSYDGEMWLSTDLAITEQAGGWSTSVSGFGKIANVPSFGTDNSPSRMRGTLFLAYSDTKGGENDNDIWLTRSVSRGDNWTAAAKINQDKSGHTQFLPQLTVDQANGHIYILYYDRRDYTDNQTDVYLAYSTDGGNQFKERKLTEQPFTADIDSKTNLTNYLSVSASEGVVAASWTTINGGKQDVTTVVLDQEDLKKQAK